MRASQEERVDLVTVDRVMTQLGREGVTQILVEGGGALAAALLRASLVDELHWFVAPRLLGGDGRPSLGDLGLKSLLETPLIEGQVRRESCRSRRVRVHARGFPTRCRGMT